MKHTSLEASQKRMTILTYAVLIAAAVIMVFPFLKEASVNSWR